MLDEIEKLIDVAVLAQGYTEPVRVKMIAAARDNNTLEMELNTANVQLLLGHPVVEQEPDVKPSVQEPNVKWTHSSHMVQCSYYDNELCKWRTKSIGIRKGLSPQSKQQDVDKAARVLQTFYEESHQPIQPESGSFIENEMERCWLC